MIIRHIDRLKNQGCDVRYYHDEIGYNYRLEGLQGAVLSVSLKYLPEWTKRRQEIGHRYIRKEITNPLITMQHHPENTTPVFHLFVITVPDHDDFVKYMADNDVECNMHIRFPCHLQKAYANLLLPRLPECGIPGSTLCDTAAVPRDAGG